jgi:hypothetical protein
MHTVLNDIYDNDMSIYVDYSIQSNQPAVGDSNGPNQAVREDSIDFMIKEKRRLLRPSEPDCFCPNGRKNWIYYTDCPGRGRKNHGAGIKDRQTILRNILWYADELCAKVALLCDPNDWLSEAHGCYAPKTSEWSSYFTTVRKSPTGSVLNTVDILYSNVNEKNQKEIFHRLRRIKGSSIEKYNLGRRLHAKDEPFVWEFDVSFWKTEFYAPNEVGYWPQQKLDHRKYNETCGVIDFDTSDELLGIAHLAMKELGLAYSQDFVTLHLRRGDYRNCNTDVKTVMKYLKCSIEPGTVKKVVVLTNEKDEQYLNNLSRNFTNRFPGMEMILLDQFMESKSFLNELDHKNIMKRSGDEFLNDNCFFFSAEKVLVSMARYHLERGHMHCKKCDRGGSNKGKLASLI